MIIRAPKNKKLLEGKKKKVWTGETKKWRPGDNNKWHYELNKEVNDDLIIIIILKKILWYLGEKQMAGLIGGSQF